MDMFNSILLTIIALLWGFVGVVILSETKEDDVR